MGDDTAVAIGAGDAQHDAPLEHELREDLPGAIAEGLASFRRVDLGEPHAEPLALIGEHGDAVAIADRDDAPAKFGGRRALPRHEQRGDDKQQAGQQAATSDETPRRPRRRR